MGNNKMFAYYLKFSNI